MMEVLEEMAISEKELKLLLNFVKDNLQEARETKDEENRNKKIDKTLEHKKIERRLKKDYGIISNITSCIVKGFSV